MCRQLISRGLELVDSIAAYLIVAGPYSYYSASTGWFDKDWVWHKEYDSFRGVGAPLGPAVRHEQVLELEAIGASLHLLHHARIHPRLLEAAKDGAAATVELIELETPVMQAADLALRETARRLAAKTADEGRAEPGVYHLEDRPDVLGVDGQFLGQVLEGEGCSHEGLPCGGRHGRSPCRVSKVV